MANRDRYLAPRDMGALLSELRVGENVFQDALLEFLERERIVLPVLRVNWPLSMVIKGRDGNPNPPPTAAEREGTEGLNVALRHWDRHDADPAMDHPFDKPPAGAATLLTRDVAQTPFRPWADFAVNVRADGEPPLRVPDAVDTYYHGWQALLIADAVEMGAQLILDTRKPDVLAALMEGRFGNLPSEEIRMNISLQAPRGLTQGLTWVAHLDAASRFHILRGRRLAALSLGHSGEPAPLTETEQADFAAAQAKDAAALLMEISTDRAEVAAHLRYLCERWDDWTRRGRAELASAYKGQLTDALRLAMSGYGVPFSDLASEVGQVTGHFAPTLDVVFPDWNTEARRKIEGSLKHSVVAHAPALGPALTLVDVDIPDLVTWLEAKEQWKVHLAVEAIIERQFRGTAVDHSGLAKEVEALGVTLEHLVDSLLGDAGLPTGGTLMPKFYRLWKGQPAVVAALKLHAGLSRTDTVSRAHQVATINALGGSDDVEVAKVLLRAVLYRNDGLHNAMAGWPEAELHTCTREFLTALMLSRKVLLVSPPSP